MSEGVQREGEGGGGHYNIYVPETKTLNVYLTCLAFGSSVRRG